MPRVYYNKLIRDNVPNTIRAKGDECEVREIQDDNEYEQELLKKVSEESFALTQVHSRDEFLSEYVDLAEVLDALCEHLKCSPEEIHIAREQNRQKKGGFTKRYFLHWSSKSNYKSNESPQGVQS